MTLPQGADYSLTESALSPFQAEPTRAPLARFGRQSFRKHLTDFISMNDVAFKMDSAVRCPDGLEPLRIILLCILEWRTRALLPAIRSAPAALEKA